MKLLKSLTLNSLVLGMLLVPVSFSMTGCDSGDGTMEKTGEKLDDAAEKAGEKIDEVGDKAEEKIEELGEKADETAEKVEDKVEEATKPE